MSILKSNKTIKKEACLDDICFLGELSLSGEIKPINGVLCMASAAKSAGKSTIFVPKENALGLYSVGVSWYADVFV
jgi:magnesium chelatase family protein